LPPYFPEPNNSVVQSQMMKLYGPIHHSKLQNVTPFLLAAIVYHLRWLKENLAQDNPFWRSGIKEISITSLKQLKGLVSVSQSETMFARGVPMGPVIFQKLHHQEELISELKSTVDQLATEQLKLTKLIPLSAAASGMMCGEVQINALKSALIDEISAGFKNLTSSPPSTEISQIPIVKDTQDGFPIYNWGGKFRFIPKSYTQDVDQRQQMVFPWKIGGVECFMTANVSDL
jgi:hypothetical protein